MGEFVGEDLFPIRPTQLGEPVDRRGDHAVGCVERCARQVEVARHGTAGAGRIDVYVGFERRHAPKLPAGSGRRRAVPDVAVSRCG
ncbi:MAG: hypothetical protein ACO307_06075 [Ilumatobacteraceae bacterium]